MTRLQYITELIDFEDAMHDILYEELPDDAYIIDWEAMYNESVVEEEEFGGIPNAS